MNGEEEELVTEMNKNWLDVLGVSEMNVQGNGV